MTLRLSTKDADGTRRLAAVLGQRSRPGDLVCLKGSLGSGKTVFVQGFARAAGFRGFVMSPTFAIARQYRTRRGTLHHLDLFRVQAGDLTNLGLEEYLEDRRGICLIEWPEVAGPLLARDRLEVTLSHRPGGRVLRVVSRGKRSHALLRLLGRFKNRS